MTSFEEFYASLLELTKSFEKKNTQLKIERDPDSDIVKIFGENMDSLSRAKNGLADVSELAFTTAEHHPYWNLLYQSVQISKTVLEKWNEDLSKSDVEEMQWSIKELEHVCKKLRESIVEKTDNDISQR